MSEFEYTKETYEEDFRIAKKVYYKCFSIKWNHLKDDLIHIGVIHLCKARKYYDESKGKFFTFAYKVVFRKMCSYLKSQLYDKRILNEQSLSLDYEYEDCVLSDMIGVEDDVFDKLVKEQMIQAIKNIILKCNYKGNKQPKIRQKYIYEYFINGLNICQIGAKYGISRQAVDISVRKYKKIIREELKKQGFLE